MQRGEDCGMLSGNLPFSRRNVGAGSHRQTFLAGSGVPNRSCWRRPLPALYDFGTPDHSENIPGRNHAKQSRGAFRDLRA